MKARRGAPSEQREAQGKCDRGADESAFHGRMMNGPPDRRKGRRCRILARARVKYESDATLTSLSVPRKALLEARDRGFVVLDR